jgi:hypothetical protein
MLWKLNQFVARRKYGIYGTSMQDWRKAKEQLLRASITRNVFFLDLKWATVKRWISLGLYWRTVPKNFI